MRVYGKSWYILLALCLALFSGCSNVFAPTAAKPEPTPYFYSEFDDIPIPSQLSDANETTIIMTPGGIKSGIQVFRGRAEVSSLNSAMVGYMQRDGWELRSSARGVRSLLLFEKADRYATIYIVEGSFNTEMQVYVSPKLSNTGGMLGGGAPVSGQDASTGGPSSYFETQYSQ